MRDTQSLWVNCSAIISLLIASLGRHESKRSPRVTKSATLTHWPALGRQSFPLHVTLLPLPIYLFLLPLFCFGDLPGIPINLATTFPFSSFLTCTLYICFKSFLALKYSLSHFYTTVIFFLPYYFTLSSTFLPALLFPPSLPSHPTLTAKCTLKPARILSSLTYST